jgi:hypothetical protein
MTVATYFGPSLAALGAPVVGGAEAIQAISPSRLSKRRARSDWSTMMVSSMPLPSICTLVGLGAAFGAAAAAPGAPPIVSAVQTAIAPAAANSRVIAPLTIVPASRPVVDMVLRIAGRVATVDRGPA